MKANYQHQYNYESIDISSTWVSDTYETRHLVTINITFVFTGTPDGEFFVDGSNDKENWFPLTFSEGQILASGSGDSHAVSIKDFSYSYFRVRYVASSGSGSLNADIQIKAS